MVDSLGAVRLGHTQSELDFKTMAATATVERLLRRSGGFIDRASFKRQTCPIYDPVWRATDFRDDFVMVAVR